MGMSSLLDGTAWRCCLCDLASSLVRSALLWASLCCPRLLASLIACKKQECIFELAYRMVHFHVFCKVWGGSKTWLSRQHSNKTNLARSSKPSISLAGHQWQPLGQEGDKQAPITISVGKTIKKKNLIFNSTTLRRGAC